MAAEAAHCRIPFEITMADETHNDKPRPGRPKGKPLSEREAAQRRTAAITHGRHAKGLLRGAAPCKRSTCLMGKETYPCSLKAKADEDGKGLEVCAPRLVFDPRAHEIVQRAIESGDPSGMAELTALPIAAAHSLTQDELAKLQAEGLVLQEEVLGKEGEVLTSRAVANPRAGLVLKLMDTLGLTAAQQAITPKASGERQRDEGVGGLATWLAGKERDLS